MTNDDTARSIFSTRPDPSLVNVRLDIIRTPPKGSLKGIILAPELTGTHTHYWHGRTLPCSGEHCPACEEKTPRRWYGYVPLTSRTTGRTVIFELTTSATPAIDRYIATYKTLRGARLEAYRIPQRANGRVVLELTPPQDPDEDLPRTPDIESVLLKMWEASWARSSVQIRPDVPRGSEDTFHETVEKATEHKKHYQRAPRVGSVHPLATTIDAKRLTQPSNGK